MNPRAESLRDALVRVIHQYTPGDQPVGVYLSGGFDSWSLVFAARAAGRAVHGYVFHIDGVLSTDLRLARENCKAHDVPLTELPISGTAPDKLIADIGFLKQKLGCRSKAEIECVWPFKKTLKGVTHTVVLLGHEDLYCMTKHVAIHMRDRMDEARAEAREHAERQNEALGTLFGLHDKMLVMPYESADVRAVFAGANWDDLHKPHDKQPTRDAFPEEFAKCKIARQGLQVGDSFIRETFAKLLLTPYNVTKARDVTAIYNRV